MNVETCPECHYMRNELTPCKCGLYSKPTPSQMPDVIYALSHTQTQNQRNYWHDCEPGTSYTRTDLCRELCSQLTKTLKTAEMLMAVVCNSSSGNWEKESEEWQEAARKYVDEYYERLEEVKHLTKAQGLLR